MNSRTCTIATVLIPLVMLAGCSHTIPQSSAKPVPPPQFGQTPPAARASLETTRKIGPESVLPVTLTADLSSVQQAIQRAIPDRFDDADHPLGADYHWTFIREGDPTVSIQDGLVTFQAVYRGEVESGAARACRLDPLYPVLEGTGQLTWRQQDELLLLTLSNPQTTITLKPESDAKCNMFNIPVHQQLAELFKQEAVKQRIANAVNHRAFSIPIQQVWERLHGPMAVSVVPANAQLCLYGAPKEFTVGSMKGSATQMMISGVARETPTALYEPTCHQPSVAPLDVKSGSVSAEGQPYKIMASLAIPYAVLNQQLQDKLFHKEAKLEKTWSDHVVIERAAAADANGRVLFSLDTSGDLNGTIYYWGTPRVEDGGNTLTFPDLQMATESKTALDSIKLGYWQLVDAKLRDWLRSASTVDLSQRVGQMKTAMSRQHKSGDLTMDLLVARQQGERAYSTPQAVVADILLEGTATAAGRLPVEGAAQGGPPPELRSRREVM
ncbi:DUF4403 family protein [Candidatus Nitrospira bockiana]